MSIINIRWLIRRDMPKVVDIEQQSFEVPWTEEQFILCMRQRNCIGMVAERSSSRKTHNGYEVAGYMIYELHKNRIHLLNFAVVPEHRRSGVGAEMVSKLKSKLSPDRRNRMALEIRETNIAAQLFFRAQGFRAISVLRNFYDDTPEDAYLMQYRYQPPSLRCTYCHHPLWNDQLKHATCKLCGLGTFHPEQFSNDDQSIHAVDPRV
jgi:[ribosomal protein S18]-alanine N-acetyltransferase